MKCVLAALLAGSLSFINSFAEAGVEIGFCGLNIEIPMKQNGLTPQVFVSLSVLSDHDDLNIVKAS